MYSFFQKWPPWHDFGLRSRAADGFGAALNTHFIVSDLLKIEINLPEIGTALPEIETDLAEIKPAMEGNDISKLTYPILTI